VCLSTACVRGMADQVERRLADDRMKRLQKIEAQRRQTEEACRRVRSQCRFVLPRIHFIPESLTYSVPLSLKRQCDRTLGGGRPAAEGCRAGGAAAAADQGPDGTDPEEGGSPCAEPGLLTQGVPVVPQDPLAPRRGPLGSSPDRESAIGNAPALVPGPLARLQDLPLRISLSAWHPR
jgi:hypothetical protein